MSKLLISPVLAYPNLAKTLHLKLMLVAILSQFQEDSRLHPLAYASRSLSPNGKNYATTKLETVAIVWAISHFR